MNKFWLHISTKHTAKPVFTPTLFIPVLELSMVDWTWLIFFTGLHPFSQDVAVSFDKLEFEILNNESDDAMNDDFSDQSASDHDENAATRDFKVKQKSSKISTVKGADKIGGKICKILGQQLIRLLEILGANDSTGLHPLGHMTIKVFKRQFLFLNVFYIFFKFEVAQIRSCRNSTQTHICQIRSTSLSK